MDAWLAQHFFNPAFVAGGSLLVASPIIIHLINRVRYRRVHFAAMEFLLQSQQQNRRRVLFEQLLLLLLRILIVLGLLALIARLILDPSQLSIFRGAKTHHFVLLDDSGSMRDQWGETTAFAEAIDVVKKLAAEGTRRPDTQSFSLALLSNPQQPLFTQRDVNEAFVNELDTKLENLNCSHRALDLLNGLEIARKTLAEERATLKQLHVISDFRDRDWSNPKAISSVVTGLDAAGVAVNFVKTVPELHENLGITALVGDVQVAAAGVPVRLQISVRNFGQQVASDVRVTISQDGQKLPLTIQFDKIEAGEEVEREFDITFPTPAKHQVEVALPADSLSADNRRFLAVDVAPFNRVLIIDGAPASDEGSYLVDALAADPEATGFAPVVETIDFLRRQPLDEFQSIFLLNVGQLPADAVDPLESYVAAGGGLAWFLGEGIKPAFYNDKLYREGQGLFPAKLALAPRDLPQLPDGASSPDLQLANHPIFRVFTGRENPYIESTRVFTYFPVSDDWQRDDQQRSDGVQTIARLRDNQPLMFTHHYGSGTIVTCLTSCGPSWNNWAVYASYVVLQLELQKFIARKDRLLDRRIVGAPIQLTLDPAEFTERVEVSAPDPTGERVTRLKAGIADSPQESTATPQTLPNSPPASTNKSWQLTYGQTDAPGIYKVKLIDLNQFPVVDWISYNVPLEESDLRLAGTEQIRRQLGEELSVEIQEPGSFHWIAGKDAGQDVREWLLMLLVGLLAVEQFLAYKFSYHPTPVPA